MRAEGSNPFRPFSFCPKSNCTYTSRRMSIFVPMCDQKPNRQQFGAILRRLRSVGVAIADVANDIIKMKRFCFAIPNISKR